MSRNIIAQLSIPQPGPSQSELTAHAAAPFLIPYIPSTVWQGVPGFHAFRSWSQNMSVKECNKVIIRIKGGLGNQLFCYAAARRLALVNNAELITDDVTGFVRDRQYRRRYNLDRFSIPARKATPWERMEPFERYRRALVKWVSRRKPLLARSYVEQDGLGFDARILLLTVRGTLYLDGLWQSEGYFKDVEQVIRRDLVIKAPQDMMNTVMAERMAACNAVAVHVRWFDKPEDTSSSNNAGVGYYRRAIAEIMQRVASPHFFVFSDDPAAARTKLGIAPAMGTYLDYNRGDENAYADLWLMTQCKHFIIANSTFSWWGAWLGKENKIVICPSIKLRSDAITAWDFPGKIPDTWLKV